MASTNPHAAMGYKPQNLLLLSAMGLFLFHPSTGSLAALGWTEINHCSDGNTCTTTTGEKIKLACIDAPDKTGRWANPEAAYASQQYLEKLISNKPVEIRRIDRNQYGQTVAELFANGKNIQQDMVLSGHADIHKRYAWQCPWAG